MRFLSRQGSYFLSGKLTTRQMRQTATTTLSPMSSNSPAVMIHQLRNRLSSMCQLSTSASVLEDQYDTPLTIAEDPYCPSPIVSPTDLLHKQFSVRRNFAANSNAQVMLTCGGESLAAHASFDPLYSRARTYIRNHPVGPAVISPVLINGLVGTLVEATLPQSIFVKNDMRQHLPLIVGVDVEASIEVVSVKSSPKQGEEEGSSSMEHTNGYELEVKTQVKRVRDGAIISDGSQTVWLPDYGDLNA